MAGDASIPTSASAGIDLPAAQLALTRAANCSATLLRQAGDPNAPVPGLMWTVAETAAHLVTELRHYVGLLSGAAEAGDYLKLTPRQATPAQRGAALNDQLLREFTERDLRRLADAVPTEVDRFIAAGATHSVEESVMTGNGVSMTVPVMTTALLGEQLIHGLDIARATGRRWPISRPEALHVIAGAMWLIPDYIDREKAAGIHLVYELRLRGGPRYLLAIDDGTASVPGPDAGIRKADCTIVADPAAFLLVGFGRTSQWRQIMRGKLIARGPKPWLGFKFTELLTSI